MRKKDASIKILPDANHAKDIEKLSTPRSS